MNYYDELLIRINSLMDEGKYESARSLVEDELSVPYVPKDILEKLENLLKEIKDHLTHDFFLNDSQIEEYLFKDETSMLIAVKELDRKNLREYLDLCEKFLCSDGYINAKVLLIDSLMRQDISEEIRMNDQGVEYQFIPKYIIPVEISDGYLTAVDYLKEMYLKEPSKYQLAKELVYKNCMLVLPVNLDEEEGVELAKDIYDYIEKAFNNEIAIH